MPKVIYCFFILGLLFSDSAYSGGDQRAVGITPDLTDMLRNPAAPAKGGESFSTYITRPFAQNPDQDMSFLSNPSHESWNTRYQAHTKTAGKVNAFDVFKTLGVSRRAVLINGNPPYEKISDAETTGMLRILQGRMGLRNTSLTSEEKEVVARELLHMGRSLKGEEVMRRVQEIKSSYSATLDSRKRQHFQTLALLMLSGHDRNLIKLSDWYLESVRDRDALLSKVYGYADRLLLPKAVGGTGDFISRFGSGYSSLPGPKQDYLKKLIKAARGADWVDGVDGMLKEPLATEMLADPNLRAVIEALIRLNVHNGLDVYDEAGDDLNILHKTYRLLFPPAAARVKPPEVSIREYLMGSSVLNIFVGVEKDIRKKAFSEALSTYVRNNGGTWPGYDLFKVNEQFFWNLYKAKNLPDSLVEDYEKAVFKAKIPGSWEDFLSFCEPYYVARQQPESKLATRQNLFVIYQAFSDLSQRLAFFTFCEPYLAMIPPVARPALMSHLLKIYQAFPDPATREEFLGFCRPYLGRVTPDQIPECMADLLPIYQAFPTPDAGKEFFKFTAPYTPRRANPDRIPSVLNNLFSVFQAFPDPATREKFLDFCGLYILGLPEVERPAVMRSLLPVYQAFPTPDEREEFIIFCDPFLPGMFEFQKPFYMKTYLSIYKAFEGPDEKDAFFKFCDSLAEEGVDTYDPSLMEVILSIYQNNRADFENFRREIGRLDADVIESYLPRNYLRYMRVDAALKAEQAPDNVRIQAMYDTHTDQQLPIVWVQDDHVQYARNVGGARANAHDFDKIYEIDRQILFKWCDAHKYNPRQSGVSHDLYGPKGKVAHQTNVEVEDFLSYLDNIIAKGTAIRLDGINIPGAKVALIVKQLLGLEIKRGETTGRFAPYLGHSMYYAQPESPLGDEMLGRVWFFMKKKAEEVGDEELKKSIVLAMLEASEISSTQVSTHCQTRMTGELMKLIAFNGLPGSQLRPLIAAEDVVPVAAGDSAAMNTRIDRAHRGAQSLFDRIKGDESVERALYEHAYSLQREAPELWEIYQAYYDILYGRTKNEDGNGYKRDENFLMRDERGNLVKLFDAEGRQRAARDRQIVYYQAEFQVLEQGFTELLRKEFEEKRGLIY